MLSVWTCCPRQPLTALWQAADHVIKFLRTFYRVFPEYLSVDVSFPVFVLFSVTHDWQTYLGGESFAGQYIPYFGTTICPGLISTFQC